MGITIRGGAAIAAAALTATAVLVTTLSVAPVETAAQPAAAVDSVVERPDVVYGSVRTPNGARRNLKLDLWLPATPEARRPAVVLAHGGGFRWGSRKNRRIRELAVFLAEHGYVTASISYRLRRAHSTDRKRGLALVRSNAARHAQHDMQAAVRFLRSRAKPFAIDRNRIAVLGSSAGGIAALRAAFNPGDPGRSGNGNYRSGVTAVVALWGASDPRMIERGAPPALMIHGRADATVPFKLARRTCRATRSLGNVCRQRWWSGEGHSAWHRKYEIERSTRRFLGWHLRDRSGA